MSEGYNYQLLTAIVKVVRPSGKPVLGVADGQGNFLWLPTDKIIMSHPMQYENWQTTIFAISPDWKITWKAEQKWDEFKGSYPSNTKPILQPIPQMFQGAQTPTVPVQQPIPQTTVPTMEQLGQMPITQATATQPANYPPPSTTSPIQQQGIVPPPITDMKFIDRLKHETLYGLQAQTPLDIIAKELTAIRELLELYFKALGVKTSQFIRADKLEKTEQEIADEFGSPPDKSGLFITEEVESKINKDKLPDIFGDKY